MSAFSYTNLESKYSFFAGLVTRTMHSAADFRRSLWGQFWRLGATHGHAVRVALTRFRRGGSSVCRILPLISATRSAGALALLSIYALLMSLCCPALAEQPTIRVALFVGNGAEASEFTKEFARSNDYSILYKRVDGNDIRQGALKHFDALLVPGGSASEEAGNMGPEAREEVRHFVDEGGIYMGICAGAYLASQAAKNDLGLLPLKTLDHENWYRVDDATSVEVELTPAGMEIFGINKRFIRIMYENGPIFALPSEKTDDSLTPLGFFRSEVVADGGERGVMLGAPAIILSRYGRGTVMAISPHFEETLGYKQVQLHALHWLYEHRTKESASAAKTAQTAQTGRSTIATAKPVQPQATHQQNISKESSSSAEQKALHVSSDNSNMGEQALKLAESILNRASVVRYVHHDVVASRQVSTAPDGVVEARTDCSGFISYIVDSIAPSHYHVVRSREPEASYPQAKVWARFFATLDDSQPHNGWLGISNWRDLKPGDFIAWQEGKVSASGNTGHVMMVASKPSEIQQENDTRYFSIEVIDSSSVYHFAPEQLPPKASQRHRNGLGMGCVRIILSEENAAIGYWAGTYWGEGQKQIKGPTLSKLVRFARMVPLEK